MKVLGFVSENCLPVLSISCVNFQERDGRKLWSFTFLYNPSCWRKLTLSPPPSFQSFSWDRAIRNLILFTPLNLQHPIVQPLLRITLASRSAAGCSPKGHQPRRGAGGQPPHLPATKLPVSAAEQTVGPANFTPQLLGKVFQLLICITLSCCPRNIRDITNSSFKKKIVFCKNFALLAIPFPLPPYFLKGLKPNKCK